MLMTDQNNIKDVIIFPAMKPTEGTVADEEPDVGAHKVKTEKTKLYQTEVSQTLSHVVAKLAGSKLEVIDVDFEKA